MRYGTLKHKAAFAYKIFMKYVFPNIIQPKYIQKGRLNVMEISAPMDCNFNIHPSRIMYNDPISETDRF